jgi:hypothetical protein
MNKDIQPRNNKGHEHGMWIWYHNDIPYFKRYYINGRLNGYFEYTTNDFHLLAFNL